MNSENPKRGYIHGYDAREQDRLRRQSDFLEQTIHEGVDLSGVNHLLEIGCGTGAQTKILLRNYPQLRITAIDISESQIRATKKNIVEYPELYARVNLKVVNAESTMFPAGSFDGAFISWVLEHARQPMAILREARRCLIAGSPIIISEVYNPAFFLRPTAPAIEHYWSKFNRLQVSMGGDPSIGMKLGNLLLDSGFRDIRMKVLYQHHDKRNDTNRKIMLDYFQQLLLSAKTTLLHERMVDEQELEEMSIEFEKLKIHPDTIIFLTGMQAVGYA